MNKPFHAQLQNDALTRNNPLPRVMISTLWPSPGGGVQTVARFLADLLSERGFAPFLAYYQPYSISPDLSVPSYRLGQCRPAGLQGLSFDRYESHGMGAWLPEFEVSHYFATAAWRRLMDGAVAHVSVAGNVLTATPFWQTGRPFLAHVGSGWDADRRDRVAAYPLVRKALDVLAVRPSARWLEKRLLRAGTILPVSRYTKASLDELAGGVVTGDILPMGIDTDFFRPDPTKRVPARIGFSGRWSDPRKNIDLLTRAALLASEQFPSLQVTLMGEQDSGLVSRFADLRALASRGLLRVVPRCSVEAMRAELQALDAFVVPSHQEGLCISALEAMACGVPVISTRCGGPEEFVIEGRTGFLVGPAALSASAPLTDAAAGMADALATVLGNDAARGALASAARDLVERRYSKVHAARVFWAAFGKTFPHLAQY